jgi:iron(III) transport system substrate-binding protein
MPPAKVDGAKATAKTWPRPSTDKAPRLALRKTSFGFRYAAIRRPITNSATHDYVRISLFVAPSTVLIPPNNLYNLANVNVPMDDTHTMFYFIAWGAGEGVPSPAEWREFCGATPGVDLDANWRKHRNRDNNYLQDREAMKTGDFTGIRGIPMQDMSMWETMGSIADRSRERLGASDLAIVEFRRIMVDAARACERRRRRHRNEGPEDRVRQAALVRGNRAQGHRLADARGRPGGARPCGVTGIREGIAWLASIAFAAGAFAQDPALVAAAKKEGEVMVYHSTQTEDLKPVFDAFTARYGIAVKEWRSSSENVVKRVIQETRAGRLTVDLIENNSPEQEALRRENMLRRMDSPHFADLRPGMLPAHQQYATSTLDVFVQAYNTEKVKREEVPKTFEDLLNPRWKDRLGIEAEDQAWFGTLLGLIGEAKGEKLFRDVVATNGISVRKGHTLLATLVASGEVPMGLTCYNYKPPQLKEKGASIDWIVLQPAVAQLHAVAVHASAPHPNAAALLYDFFLGEGQALLAKRNFVPSSKKVPSPFGDMPIKGIDPAEALDKQDAWLKRYQDIFIRRP